MEHAENKPLDEDLSPTARGLQRMAADAGTEEDAPHRLRGRCSHPYPAALVHRVLVSVSLMTESAPRFEKQGFLQ